MNKRKTLAILASFILCFSAIFTACSRERGTKVVIKGSTTVLPITQKAAEKFKKDTNISVSIEGSGSGNGIKALLDGSCDIANSSREMKKEELENAKAKNLKIKEICIAYDMIVPIANPANKIKNISTEQLKAIYDGSVTNWSVVGGNKDSIVIVSRDTSSGTYEVWNEKVMNKADVRKDALLQASNGAVLSTVSENKKGLGYIGFGYLNDSVKALTVNGIEPTIANGKSGRYPISRKLFIYINESKLSKEADDFIKFLLSSEGQELVKEAGFIPL